MAQLNITPLRFYESIEEQNHRREWAERIVPLIVQNGFIPPFQFVKPKTGGAVTEMQLVFFPTPVQQNILTDMNNTGLTVEQFPDFDIVQYLGTVGFSSSQSFDDRAYYLKMKIDNKYYYSEVFTMCSDVSRFIRIEYWHNENFTFGNGLIQYEYPYKSRIYIDSDIAKPSYQYEERVSRRQGRNYPREQVSYKLHRFEFLTAEYIIEAIRSIRLHDNVEIYYAGQTYEVDEFLMESPEWVDGNIAQVICEFQTDTVLVKAGRGIEDTEYINDDGTCFVPDEVLLGYVVEGSSDWTNGEYTDRNGNTVTLVNNDKVLVEQLSGDLGIATWNGSLFVFDVYPLVAYTVYVTSINKYYLADQVSTFVNSPIITSATVSVVSGITFPGSWLEVYVQDGAIWVKTGQGSASAFEGAGIAYNSLNSDYVKVVASTVACPNRWESPIFLISQQAWVDPSGDPWTDPGGSNWIWFAP